MPRHPNYMYTNMILMWEFMSEHHMNLLTCCFPSHPECVFFFPVPHLHEHFLKYSPFSLFSFNFPISILCSLLVSSRGQQLPGGRYNSSMHSLILQHALPWTETLLLMETHQHSLLAVGSSECAVCVENS